MNKEDASVSQGRPRVRSDKLRNQARLIDAAKSAFAADGAGVTLEQIARDAGVGIGTLYRHFPTRDVLIEAVYRQEVDFLTAEAKALLAQPNPLAALRTWLLMFIDFLATKQGMADLLGTLIAGTQALYGESTVRLGSAITDLAAHATEAGALRLAIDPIDLLRAIGGVASVSPAPDWKRSAYALVDLLLAGAQNLGIPR
jgi:AcrR family transcriptional regulator